MGIHEIAIGAPPFPIQVAILSAFVIPGLLVLLGYAPKRIRNPGTRFKTAVVAAWLAMFFGLAAGALFGVGIDVLDVLAGAAIVAAASVLAFIAWSLIAWGFTLNMLLILSAESQPFDLDAWAERYVGGGGIRKLAADRLQVLFDARFACGDEYGLIILTPLGRTAGICFNAIRSLLGINRR